MIMPLALFDLDNTLLAGDSDYLWGRFLSAEAVLMVTAVVPVAAQQHSR